MIEDPDPTGYYARRAEKQREMIPLLEKVLYLLVAIVALASLAALLSPEAEAQIEEPQGLVTYEQSSLWALTGEERLFSWCEIQDDVVNMALFYQLQILEFPPRDPQVPVLELEREEGDPSAFWTPTRAGAYFFQVRSCRTDIDPADPPSGVEDHPTRGPILCSPWRRLVDSQSQNPDGCGADYPRGAFLNIQLAPATGGGIE